MKLWWRFWKWFDSLDLGSSGIGVVDVRPRRKIGEL